MMYVFNQQINLDILRHNYLRNKLWDKNKNMSYDISYLFIISNVFNT